MSDSNSKIFRNIKDIKEQAQKIGKGAAKTAGSVKTVIKTGIDTSISALDKAKQVINKEGISQGIDVTSKGTKAVAKGARLASQGADTLAKTLDKASEKMLQLRDKLKKK